MQEVQGLEMKILVIDSLYPPLLEELGYLKEPATGELYEALSKDLDGHKYGSGAMLAQELVHLGNHCEVVYANSFKSQLAWARSRGLKLKTHRILWKYWQHISRLPVLGLFLHRKSALMGILLSQISEFMPDVIYSLNMNLMDSKTLRNTKSSGIFSIAQHASPIPPKVFFSGYDHIFSAHPRQVDYFQKQVISSSHLPLAFDLEQFQRMELTGWPSRSRQITFVGTFGRHQKNTGPLMSAIAKRFPGFELFTLSSKSALKKFGVMVNWRGNAWGRRMYEVLAESQIVINRHGPIAQGYSVNYRMFEATGMGALLLTEESLNIAELFEPNREILTYSSVEDLLEKIDFALANPDALRSIAKAGQQKTLGTHTFANRARAVHTLLESKLGT
jgi:hypothetical protein